MSASSATPRAAKVRGGVFPQEYHLALLVKNISVSFYGERWSENTPACSWNGITCDTDQNIINVGWYNCGLNGSLQWSYLPSTLLTLEVALNSLCGTVSWDILPSQLVILSLHRNYLTGEVLLHNLPHSLKEMHLQSNNFCGNVYFQNLHEGLQVLYLSLNPELYGSIDCNKLPTSLRYRAWYGTNITLKNVD